MDISCPRCGGLAEPAGHEDARAFYRCPTCDRIWAAYIAQTTAPHPPRVLVADDSPEMLGLLTAWLEDEGCMVIAVGSGREAIEAAGTYHPDAVFLDVVLPPPDGIQVAETLTRRRGTGIVLMTGMSNPDRKRIAESGALLLLEKPFAREALMDALTLALDYSRRNDSTGHAAAN